MNMIRSRRKNRRQAGSNDRSRSSASGIGRGRAHQPINVAEESILYPFGKHQKGSNSQVSIGARGRHNRASSRENNKNSVFSVSSGSGPPPSSTTSNLGVFSVSSGSGPPPTSTPSNLGAFSVSSGSGPPPTSTTSNLGAFSVSSGSGPPPTSTTTNLGSFDDNGSQNRLSSPSGGGMLRNKMEKARLVDKNVTLTQEMQKARSATEAHRRFLKRSADIIKDKSRELKQLQQNSKTEVGKLESRIEELELALQSAEEDKQLCAKKHAQELSDVQSHLLSQLNRVRMECAQQTRRVHQEVRRKAEAEIAQIRAATDTNALQAELEDAHARERKLLRERAQLRQQLNTALAPDPAPAPSKTDNEAKADGNIYELQMESLRNELTLQKKTVQQLQEQLKERVDVRPGREAEHRAAMDEFKEIMEEEMETMRANFEAQLSAEKTKFQNLSRRFNAVS